MIIGEGATGVSQNKWLVWVGEDATDTMGSAGGIYHMDVSAFRPPVHTSSITEIPETSLPHWGIVDEDGRTGLQWVTAFRGSLKDSCIPGDFCSW